jgi:type II secretory pathway component PulK
MRRTLRRADDSSGMALLVILMILVILAVLIHRFTFATRVHMAAAANVRDQLQAECMAISGLESAMTVLRQDDTLDVDHLGEPWALFQGSKDISALEAMEGAFAVRIQDESARSTSTVSSRKMGPRPTSSSAANWTGSWRSSGSPSTGGTFFWTAWRTGSTPMT